MEKRTLNLEWTGRVEVERYGTEIRRYAVWEGFTGDGEKVRVRIEKIEEIKNNEDK